MTPMTVAVILALILMGATKADTMTEFNDQDMTMSPKTKNMLDTLQTALKERNLIKSDIQLFPFLVNFVQQKIRELEKKEKEFQDELVLNRGSRE